MIQAKVYWNLHRKCFSVQVNGRVVAHATALTMFWPEFKVSAAGRRRVLRTRRKNVHAFVVGHVVEWAFVGGGDERSGLATYNPYENETFVDKATGQELRKADAAWFSIDADTGRPRVQWMTGNHGYTA